MKTPLPAVRSDFLATMIARGHHYQGTALEPLDAALQQGVVPAYIGFDCTADSLHVGSLIQIMRLYWLQQCGHKPVILMGGGTSRIGDPSGRDESRQMLSPEQIAANKKGIQRIFENYLTFGDGPTDALMLDNAEWLNSLNYIEFLRDYGFYFTINRMLTFDSVKLRLERENPLTFLEFNYMILQAYDFLELHRRYGVRLQLGGSDQWGNIVNGIELIRKHLGQEVFGLTSPLLTTASGQKMGKTAGGAVWLNEEKLSSYDFWQFWRNVEDADVARFLRLYTVLPLEEIDRLAQLEGAEINEAKKILADAVTTMARGADAARFARQTAEQTFEKGGIGEDLPLTALPAAHLSAGVPLLDVLLQSGLAASKSEARRLVRGGGVKINDLRIDDENRCIDGSDLKEGLVKLTAGKKRHALIKAV